MLDPKLQPIILTVAGLALYIIIAPPQYKLNILIMLILVGVLYVMTTLIFSGLKCNKKEDYFNTDHSGENLAHDEHDFFQTQSGSVDNHVCKGGGEEKCGNNDELLPIFEPAFNLRECAKQLLLLEDHLNNPRKRCEDCIKKHCMTIEALAEEGTSLDKEGNYREECNKLAEAIRQAELDISADKDYANIAQALRKIRKPLMVKYFDKQN